LYYWGWFAQRRLPVPVVSVGNLTLGGTGKTPVVIQLVEWLLAQGTRVAILSRGYRRTSMEPYLLVSNGEQLLVGPNEAGDEPFLMAQRCPRAIVAVGADRYELGCWVLDRFPVDCLILDDGFQHLGLYRDVNLLLVDATDAEGLSALVPAGRLREPLQAAARATAIVVTRADVPSRVTEVCRRLRAAIGPIPDPIQAVFRPESLVSVVSGASQPLSWSKGKAALLCSAVGHAGSFRTLVESIGIKVLDEVVYVDHHAYTSQDVERLRARATALQAELVVTTEKDACKLAALLQPTDTWWAVRLTTDVTVGEDRLRQVILGRLKTED
ncbi:MAG: tetraacyldisaccharide 4'-kinase, partial [Nitrospiraceae bacterium]